MTNRDAPRKFSYESMGTGWEVTVWDDVSGEMFAQLQNDVVTLSRAFDEMYSRFIPDSLIWSIAKRTGTHEVPTDMTAMLRLYCDLYEISGRKLNPLVGFAISDLGYDERYSLRKKEIVRPVPDLFETLSILDDTHIETKQEVLLDLGALGKGYFVDILADRLANQGIKRFLINGSGDMRYTGTEPILCGLEHPVDKTKVIGVLPMDAGALCASGTDRRSWDGRNHVLDPLTLESPTEIVATWVRSDRAALSDALATCLFLTDPEPLARTYSFEYCILNRDMRVKHSPGFRAEWY